MQPSVLAKRVWFLLFTVISAFYLWGLGALPLVGADEPRYAQVAREMLARRDWITPTLGGLPWFEKPPLLYWMMMASFRVFGVNEYAARLGPAICGLVTAVFVYCLGRSVDVLSRGRSLDLGGYAAADSRNSLRCWSALVWLSSLGAITFSRGASHDIILTMTVTGAMACFFACEVGIHGARSLYSTAVSGHGRQTLLLCGFYFFIGLSLLAKGLIGPVLIFGVISFYYLVRFERPAGRVLRSIPWGVPLSLVVGAVWYGPMLAHHGWRFVDQFFVQHHFARFLSNKYHHPAPFYFYVPVILFLAWPWTILLGASLFSAVRWHWRGNTPIDRVRIFALIWVVLPLIFFSLSGSKLIGYILPALPAVALLGGERIVCFLNVHRGELVLRLTGVLVVALAAGGAWYGIHEHHLSALSIGLAAAPLIIVGGAAMVRPRPVRLLFLLIALAVFPTSAIVLKSAIPVVTRKDSVHELLNVAAARGYATTPVVQLHDLDRTAEFYAAGRISYGADGEPLRFEGVQQVRDAAKQNGGVVLCLVPIEYESQLTSYAQVETEMIGNNGRLVMLAVYAK